MLAHSKMPLWPTPLQIAAACSGTRLLGMTRMQGLSDGIATIQSAFHGSTGKGIGLDYRKVLAALAAYPRIRIMGNRQGRVS